MESKNLKDRIISCYAALKASYSEHNAKILNKASAELFSMTGEVYSNGTFVKAA